MFLSRFSLNLRDRQVRFDLARPYEMHRTLWNAFPDGEPGRVLFRVDSDPRTGRPTVIVQSENEPEWSRLPDKYLNGPATHKLLELHVVAGQRLRFRLRANPTKRVAAKNPHLGGTMLGKRVGLLIERDQIRWLLRKADGGGFSIPGQWIDAGDPETGEPIQLPNFRVDAISEGTLRNVKEKDSALVAVRFEGVLAVTDPDHFRQTVFAGIGPGKAFGFGLLSVAPLA